MPGEVLVTITKAGYATVARTQAVAGGATATLDVVLAPPGTIIGKVTSSVDGAALAGAVITYSGGTVTTDASGNASFGLGLGANVLVGGSNRTISLQPLSVEGQVGVNLALGVARLTLR